MGDGGDRGEHFACSVCAFYLRKLVLYWTKLARTNETIIKAFHVLFARQANFRGAQGVSVISPKLSLHLHLKMIT